MSELLAWTDLETAGTNELNDPILEIAVVVTGPDLEEIGSCEAVIRPLGWAAGGVPGWIRPEVSKMHTDSGLWEDCASRGVPAWEAEGNVTSLLAGIAPTGGFVLAGSGVSHFDRRFLKAQMPRLERWFKYYCIDVGVLRRTLAIIGRDDLIPPAPAKPHRAMADVRLHISELRHIRQALGPASEILR